MVGNSPMLTMRRRLKCAKASYIQHDDDGPETQGTFSLSPHNTPAAHSLLFLLSYHYCYLFFLLLRSRYSSPYPSFRSLHLVVVCVLVLLCRQRISDLVVWRTCTPRTIVWWMFEPSFRVLLLFCSTVTAWGKSECKERRFFFFSTFESPFGKCLCLRHHRQHQTTTTTTTTTTQSKFFINVSPKTKHARNTT